MAKTTVKQYKSLEEMNEAMKKVVEEGFELDRPWDGGWKLKHSDGREALVNVHINEVTFIGEAVFEARGILAGIIKNPKGNVYNVLNEIRDIIGYYEMEKDLEKRNEYIIIDHWVMENVEEGYWGVYYKKGHQCVVNTSSKAERFKNGFFKMEGE
ncbi:hypothetical protein ACFVIX_18795 [Bacillus subtilis]|uniref:Uncharacterized protein n=1 Tax=Bacillus subtilis TaxID=1423 RepID=A0A0D1K8N1_BACIU|nr:hypothetical protein [Bacillus subtilis]KIU04485.1 hypothetical protein SC09_contig8orf00139 [Bacillus subtilis]MCB4341099.1 hypothetical protein [Bacillus subtilis]MDK7656910.1 hypothetical protein [Bacillus subtilis]MDQ4711715.1 hypothetical protein [Bacillus subtilis]